MDEVENTPTADLNAKEGLVIRSTGAFYRVRLAPDLILDCTLRGKLRLGQYDTTNPIAVGDRVKLSQVEGKCVIDSILPRENYLLRKAPKAGAQNQILCANIDQGIILASIDYPLTTLGAIDRFLVMLEAFHIPPIIVFNKIDLLKKEKQLHKLEDYIAIYEQIAYPVYALSATDLTYQNVAKSILRDKVSFIGGVSGAGKSTFINLADNSLNLRTGSISKHTNKGKHTTTFAEMFSLSFGGAIIDAPGFRDFLITEIAVNELSQYFPEMRAHLSQCKFNNCTHTSEPSCAVKDAVEAGAIPETRYNTYLGMLASL